MFNLTNASLFIGFLETLTIEVEFGLKILEILEVAREDRYFHSLIYSNHGRDLTDRAINGDIILPLITGKLQVPVIQLTGNTSFYIWPLYNRELFALVSLRGDEELDKMLLETLWRTLHRSLRTRILLVAKAELNRKYLRNLLEYCTRTKAWNIIVIKEDFLKTQEFYRPQVFPEFNVNTVALGETGEFTYYPDHIKNMKGYPLRLSLSKSSSWIYVMKIKFGTFVLGGQLGHLFEEFAHKLNATIDFPHYGENSVDIVHLDIEKLLENGTYDIATEPLGNLYSSDTVYSNVFDFVDWCVMVPVARSVPAYMFYAKIFDLTVASVMVTMLLTVATAVALTFWIEGCPVHFNDFILKILYVSNGFLGQSYKMEPNFAGIRSFLYILIAIGGIVFNTSFVTYLQAFKACPPKERAILAMEDIHDYGLELAITQDEYDLLEMGGKTNIFKAFAKIFPSPEDLYALRDNYDNRYAYAIATPQWLLYEQQQQFFAIHRFRFSDICFYTMAGIMLPMQPNSPYEEAFNNVIDQISQGGLMQFWKSLAFVEAVQRKRIALMDISITTDFEPMKLSDLRLLMTVFAVMLGMVCFCFAAEICWSRRRVLTRKLNQVI